MKNNVFLLIFPLPRDKLKFNLKVNIIYLYEFGCRMDILIKQPFPLKSYIGEEFYEIRSSPDVGLGFRRWTDGLCFIFMLPHYNKI